ncbi:hypothetical protein [Pseudomonas umsongensis]|nr:hypothetical protein [Pseudomonas umsongensis]
MELEDELANIVFNDAGLDFALPGAQAAIFLARAQAVWTAVVKQSLPTHPDLFLPDGHPLS